MTTTFVVIQEAGPGWAGGVAMEEQAGWPEHAKFMNALVDEGNVVLGGPLSGERHQAMLIIRARDEAAVRAQLAADPWLLTGVLRIERLARWELRLGELPPPPVA